MALKFITGFDWPNVTTDLQGQWDNVPVSGISFSTPAFAPGNAIQLSNSGDNLYRSLEGVTPTGGTQLLLGFRFKSTDAGEQPILKIGQGATVRGMLVKKNMSSPIALAWVASATPSATPLVTTTETFATGTWVYVELAVDLNNVSNGFVRIRINGVPIEASGISATGGTTANRLTLSSPATTTHDYDDLYMADNTAGQVSALVGDVRIKNAYVSGDSATIDFDTVFPASPTTHFSKLNGDDAGPEPDGDNSYIQATSPNVETRCTHAGHTIDAADTIYGVQVGTVMKDASTNAKDVSLGILSGDGGSASYPTFQTLTDGAYRSHFELFEEDPFTSTAWTKTGVDGAEVGVKTAP